jgi:glutaredoxin
MEVNMSKSYKVYATAACPYCRRLVQALVDHKENFYVVYVDSMPDFLKEKKEFYNHPTVPIVILRENGEEKLIGGCDDTLELLKTKEDNNE